MTTTASPATGSWLRDPVLRLLVAGALLNSIAFFATLPFLTLYLSDISTLSHAAIGAVVGAVSFPVTTWQHYQFIIGASLSKFNPQSLGTYWHDYDLPQLVVVPTDN